MAFKMNQKVIINAIKSTDGIPQIGVIIGLIKIPSKTYLSAFTFNSHLKKLNEFEYVVCYERINRIFTEKYNSSELEAISKFKKG